MDTTLQPLLTKKQNGNHSTQVPHKRGSKIMCILPPCFGEELVIEEYKQRDDKEELRDYSF